MNYRPLPGTDLNLSEIGLGCASYWGKKIFSERQAIDVVHMALDQGVTYLDTGHSYSGGHAETRLGRALKSHPLKEQAIISSKVGTRVGHFGRLYKDFSPKWIKQSVDCSLRKLQVEHLPLLFLHGPNPEDFNHSVYQVLSELQAEGKVGAIGINAFDDHIIQMAVDSGQCQVIMLDHNLFMPKRPALIQQLTEQGLGVVVAGALAGGIYTKKFNTVRSMKSLWYWLRAKKNAASHLKRVNELAFLHEQGDWKAVQLALAYVLNQSNVASALIGTTQPKHLFDLIAISGKAIPPRVLQHIQAFQEQTQ